MQNLEVEPALNYTTIPSYDLAGRPMENHKTGNVEIPIQLSPEHVRTYIFTGNEMLFISDFLALAKEHLPRKTASDLRNFILDEPELTGGCAYSPEMDENTLINSATLSGKEYAEIMKKIHLPAHFSKAVLDKLSDSRLKVVKRICFHEDPLEDEALRKAYYGFKPKQNTMGRIKNWVSQASTKVKQDAKNSFLFHMS